MKKIYAIFVCLLFIGTILAASAVVGAPKPDKPPKPPGGGPEATGMLFFHLYQNDESWVYTMNADGSEKTKQTLVEDAVLPLSRLKHGNYYWYLDFQPVEGIYPDGLQRHEIFAIRDDNGKTVQLTTDANLATVDDYHSLTWGIDDEYISWSAKKFVDGNSIPISGGIYTAEIEFDGGGDVTGLSSTPTLIWDSGFWYVSYEDVFYPRSIDHDWSPDGNKIVHRTVEPGGLYIIDTTSQLETFLTDGFEPKWSPDGNYITYTWQDDLRIIKPDGTDEKVLVKSRESWKGWSEYIRSPAWSPCSNFVSYLKLATTLHAGIKHKTDIYYVEIDGSDKTCLTKDLAQGIWKYNWHWR